jgi:hypothetical protein
LADLQVEWQQREAQIVANHHAKLKAVLSPQQLVRLYRAEKEFKHHAQRMQHGHHGPPAHPRGPQPAHYGQCPAPGPNGRGAVGPQGGHHRGQPGAHPRRQGNPSQQPAPPAEPGDADED